LWYRRRSWGSAFRVATQHMGLVRGNRFNGGQGCIFIHGSA
jgi:hypothetical protein